MKKLAILLCVLIVALGVMTSCAPMFEKIEDDTAIGDNGGDNVNPDTPPSGEDPDSPPSGEDPETPPSGEDPDTPPSGEDPETPPESNHKYTEFNAEELALIAEYFDFELPFIATDYYELQYHSSSTEEGVYYYTVGNTIDEFNAFLDSLSDFEFYGTDVDADGDTWYFYGRGDACLDVVFYEYEGESYIELYLYYYTSTDEPTTDESPLKEGQGYLIKGTNSAGTFYFDGTLSGGRFNATANISSAALVYVERSGSGYLIYFNVSGTKTYVVMGDGSSKGSITTKASSATVFEWNSYKNTLVVMDDDNNRAFGMKPEDSYSNFSCYDVSNSYNYGEYIPYDGSTDPDDGGDTPPSGGDSIYLYNSFTSSELSELKSFAGFVIPFIPTNEYYFDSYEYEGEVGIEFFTYGNTEAEFHKFLSALSGFTSSGIDTDDYGYTWYLYDRGDFMLDATYYVDDEGVSVIAVYLFTESGSSSGGGGTASDDIMTNIGAGLPESGSGIYEIEFTDALYVKNVSDQGYYLDGCPTTGKPAVLVIPVDFSDMTASSLGYDIDILTDMLVAGSDGCEYYSLHDYYYISSYGQLDLDITVLDYWFRPKNTSSYYYKQTTDYYGDSIPIGDQMVLDEALAYLESRMDLSAFDSDKNGIIDSVILVNTLEIDDSDNFYWAYRYWNIYADSEGYYYEYDGVSANDYIWMSYQFIFESTDSYGNVTFNDKSARCPYTFIHEFGHVLGADDYYDTTGETSPLGGYDVMDAMSGDHNPFTKINYGWITKSRLIVADGSVTVTIEDFSQNGDTVIIASNWDPKLGAYQEYYVLMYYTNKGLNSGEYGYFDRDGIVVYKVNASLYVNEQDGEIYYDIYNSNTSPSDTDYGTEENLIELVKSAKGGYTFAKGDKSSTLKDSTGSSIGSFVVDSLGETNATITFTRA